MAILPIVKFPAAILKTKCKPVAAVTEEVRALLNDMVETMVAAPGVGLAAPQVGHSIRACVIDISAREEPDAAQTGILKLINPEITAREGEISYEEGCLSIPNFHQVMKRSEKISVRYIDETGAGRELAAEGLLAIACQHEIDHLNGKLIIDQLSRLKQKMYLTRLKKAESEKKAHDL